MSHLNVIYVWKGHQKVEGLTSKDNENEFKIHWKLYKKIEI